MCVVIKSRPEFKMGHVGSKTRSLGQFLEKPCVLSRRHSFDPVFMKLCQNDFLTLNKRLSRRAMLSDDSSCFLWERYKYTNVKMSVCPSVNFSCPLHNSDTFQNIIMKLGTNIYHHQSLTMFREQEMILHLQFYRIIPL